MGRRAGAGGMPAMLPWGPRAGQSVAGSRIAATLRGAWARCARGAVLRALLEGIPKIPFPNSDVRANVISHNSYISVQVSVRAGPEDGDHPCKTWTAAPHPGNREQPP